jgi:hypothetical protein
MIKKNILLCLFVALPLLSIAQLSLAQPAQRPKMLLMDRDVQLDATQAVNDMYNYKFDKAERQYKMLKWRFPKHPLPYFLLGLSEWWKIVPNIDVTTYDDKLIAYMDTTIMLAEKLLDEDSENIEAHFFLSAAHGFKGRIYSERKNWRKATVAGKTSLTHLEKSKGNEDLSPELLFGDGLFNYYSVWVPENYFLLRPVLAFFPKGDKELGIKQLSDVSRNAFYTRTEAQYFLMKIYGNEESRPDLALPIAEYLYTTFPDNPYFERSFARYAFTQGKLSAAEKASKDMLYKIENKYPGYEATSGRYAAFYLGYISKLRNNNEDAKKYFKQSVQFAEQLGAYETGYYHFSLTNLAQIADAEEDYDLARSYYKEVVKRAEKKSNARLEAENYLKKNKKKKKRA